MTQEKREAREEQAHTEPASLLASSHVTETHHRRRVPGHADRLGARQGNHVALGGCDGDEARERPAVHGHAAHAEVVPELVLAGKAEEQTIQLKVTRPEPGSVVRGPPPQRRCARRRAGGDRLVDSRPGSWRGRRGTPSCLDFIPASSLRLCFGSGAGPAHGGPRGTRRVGARVDALYPRADTTPRRLDAPASALLLRRLSPLETLFALARAEGPG